MRTELLALAWVLLGMLLPSVARAGTTRTVCYEVQSVDSRTDCNGPSTPGVTRACKDKAGGDRMSLVGHTLQIWDKDNTTSDDLIASVSIGAPGRRCHTFEWDSISGGEADPDVYLRYVFRARRTCSGSCVHQPPMKVVDHNEGPVPQVQWRGSAFDNCTDAAPCHLIPPGQTFVVASQAGTDRAGRVMALGSAQRALQEFGGHFTQDDITMIAPCDPAGCLSSLHYGSHKFQIDAQELRDPFTPPHEAGHTLHCDEFGIQIPLAKACPGSVHSLTSVGSESCTTAEGFAIFVSMAAWWDPDDVNAAPEYIGNDIESNTPIYPSTQDYGRTMLAATRAFWDLADHNQESGDFVDATTTEVAHGWSEFGPGWSDLQEFEAYAWPVVLMQPTAYVPSNFDNEHGTNGIDSFELNAGVRFGSSTDFEDTFLIHNGLDAQDD